MYICKLIEEYELFHKNHTKLWIKMTDERLINILEIYDLSSYTGARNISTEMRLPAIIEKES